MGIIASGRMERRKWILRELHRGGRFSEVKRAASPVTRETMEAMWEAITQYDGRTDHGRVHWSIEGMRVYAWGYDERSCPLGSSEPARRKRELGSSGLRGPVRGGVPRL